MARAFGGRQQGALDSLAVGGQARVFGVLGLGFTGVVEALQRDLVQKGGLRLRGLILIEGLRVF